ncbi:MAG: hypothetical protein HY645_03600 [Acidobacteria bacterium]|nr:hypothetical protein [Acidobacteriota bacterium]
MVTFSGAQRAEVYHLLIKGLDQSQIEIFSESGKSLEFQEPKIDDGDKLHVVIAAFPKPLPVSLRIRRVGDDVKGDWLFSHFQYQGVGGEIVGRRVSRHTEWAPFEQLRKVREEGIVDIMAYLRSQSPPRNPADFENLWNTRIEPVFYFLLDDWLYGDFRDPDLKKKRLAQILSFLSQDAGRQRALPFSSQVQQALKQLQSRVPEARISTFLVHGFADQATVEKRLWSRPVDPNDTEEKCCSRKPQLEEVYLIFDAIKFSKEPQTSPLLVQRELLRYSLWPVESTPLGVDIFKRAVALSMVWPANLSFPSPPEGSHHLFKEKFGLEFEKNIGPEQMGYFLPPGQRWTEAPAELISFELAGYLKKQFPVQEMLKWNPVEIHNHLQTFLSHR